MEDGLDRAVVVEPISVVDPRVQDWFSQFPELEEIAELGDRVRLQVAGQVVEIRFDEP